MSEIEKSAKEAIIDMSDRLQVERNKLLVMNNHLLSEVLQVQKKNLETFEKLTQLENEIRIVSERDGLKTDQLQVQLNETVFLTHSPKRKLEESVRNNTERLENVEKNIVRLENGQSDLSARMGKVETHFAEMSSNVTNDLVQIKEELFRLQSICSPPCENGGQCVKNVCNCMPFFTGDRCQEGVCSPPCENGGECSKNNVCNCPPLFAGDRCQDAVCVPPCKNGGQCLKNNVCNCTTLFYGDRCQDWPQCGVDYDYVGENNRNSLVWPWMAAVYRNGNEQICDGSIIHRQFVMTSGLCAYYHEKDTLSVKLGFSDLKNRTHLQEYKVQSRQTHPQFRRGTVFNYDYEISLLKLEKPISFNSFVRPVCLPPRNVPQDKPFYKPLTTATAVNLHSYIQAVSSSRNVENLFLNLTIRPYDVCRRKLTEGKYSHYFPSTNLWFCAESPSNLCHIRYGTPTMQSHVSADGSRIWTQVGIGSFCHAHHYYSPRLDHLVPWVEATIAASS